MSEIGLNIREAHAFCTIDGYSLDVFVVDDWEHKVFIFYLCCLLFYIMHKKQFNILITGNFSMFREINFEIDKVGCICFH